ncbi:MAG: Trk system potassium transporter TrkA [Acidobacteriota bacterium]|jgi:trk system potassium uptake protein TrkA|nr:Trk system potassium transporter TrkA [Acidobacteriota bacterium]
MDIVIFGAGKTGQYLARTWSSEGNDITLIESDPDLCERLRDQLDVMVIESRGIKREVFNSESLGDCDLFIAVSSNDEMNILSASVAKKIGAHKTVVRVRDDRLGFMDELIDLDYFGIDMIVHPEMELSREIENLLSFPSAIDVYEFYNGRIMLLSTLVGADSPILGKSLAEISTLFSLEHVRIVVIERGLDAHIPRGDFVVEENDKFFVVSGRDNLEEVFAMTGFHGGYKGRNIMIHGGGKLVETIARYLEGQGGFNLKIITEDEKQAEYFSETLNDCLVVHGEGTDLNTLAAEGIIDMDFFLALTVSDEINVVSSLLANHLRVKRTVTRIEKIDYLPVSKTIGLSRCVNSSIATANAIMRFMKHGKVLSSSTLKGTNVIMVTFQVSEDSRYLGIPLSELQAQIPRNAIIGAIYRDSQTIVPSGEDSIKPGDEMIVFLEREALHRVEKMFG